MFLDSKSQSKGGLAWVVGGKDDNKQSRSDYSRDLFDHQKFISKAISNSSENLMNVGHQARIDPLSSSLPSMRRPQNRLAAPI